MNLQELLDPLDMFPQDHRPALAGHLQPAAAKGLDAGLGRSVALMHGVIRLVSSARRAAAREILAEERPDLVVSLVPNFNRAMGESLRQALPGAPLVTILTDLADYPPHFWIERQDQYLDLRHGSARRAGARAGHAETAMFPRFRHDSATRVFMNRSRSIARRSGGKLGLDPDRPTGLVLFGGQGSSVMLEIARRLDLQLDCSSS